MSSPAANLSQLIGDSGLDDDAVGAMQLTADTLGPAIAAGFGDITLDDVKTSEVLLVTMLVDDSGSIRFAGNAQVVRDGCNIIRDSLRGSKQSESVLITCRYLNATGGNHGVLYPYVTLDTAPTLDSHNYNPNGGTPLYDQTAVTLTTVAAKMAEFEAGGVTARAVTVIVSDGADQHSYQHGAADVAQMVGGMLRSERHVIAGMGIDDKSGYGVDFRAVFREMGLRDEWILTPGDSEHDIRQAFQVVSQSAVRASQTAGSNFSKVALGGFGG